MVGYRGLDLPEAVHRGMPSSTLTFIVSLDDGVEAADSLDALAGARPIPVLLGGLHLRASQVRQRRGQAGVQVAVHPLAARALFGVPAAELSVTDFDGASVLGRPSGRLHERATETQRWPDAFSLVADYLIDARRGRDVVPVRPEVAHAWHLLERSRGRVPVGAVADRVGVSTRHLTTMFGREVGRTPKTVAMLMRFEHVIARIADAAHRQYRIDLAGIAADAGYCDQAHLTREFARFTGVPPRTWLAEEFRNIQDGAYAYRSESKHEHYECTESDRLVDPASP
ncbi:MAG TPA: helix-turn-helix domain-containing protein [Mycobacterium sp.]|nr:helix-turn-helix domain-containing protein [Mycobacterium sp.]